MTLPAGTRLGPYEILSPIGAGGMGEVYRARDTRLQRDVAIKMPPAELLQNPVALARFERETHAVAALSHPNILEIHDVGTEGGVTYAVTELLHGETLRRRLSSGPLPWPRAVVVAAGIANGLAAAHGRGVVHRDLKPENLFLTEDEHVKILDFGLARLEPSEERELTPEPTTATETGAIIGTVGYMSPEQVRGERADARSDIFSLGCVLYEMVTGLRAFSSGSPAETLVAVLREEPTEAGQLVPDLPDGLCVILRHCMAKDPRDRFQSARDLALALDDVARGVSLRTGRLPVKRPMPRVAVVSAGLILAALAALGVRSILAGRGAIDSLAVLPFANAGGEPEMDYLSDGISESLANSLSRIQNLRLPARNSVFAYKGEADPLKAGRALGTGAVLTGKLSRRGSNIVVQVELDEVSRGAQIWGERYERSAADLLLIEQEIVEEVARRLHVRSKEVERSHASNRPTSNPEAYDLYLQGRFYWNKRDGESIGKSVELYERAIALDPNFALALVGLADSYDVLAFYGAAPPKEVLPKGLNAATRALQIDDSLAEAHASLADMKYQYEWDWAGAEQEFRKAIALNPNYATAHQWYSNYLTAASRFEESFREIRIARQLDPMDLMIRADEGLAYHLAGNDEKAIALLRQTVELEPNFPLARLYLALVAAKPGAMETSITESRKAMELMEGEPDPIAFYGYACGMAGQRAEALRAHAMLEELSRKRFVSAFAMAVLDVGLGEKAETLTALEEAHAERAGRLVFLRVERLFDPLRAEPRFQRLVASLKIPAPAQTSPSARPAASP